MNNPQGFWYILETIRAGELESLRKDDDPPISPYYNFVSHFSDDFNDRNSKMNSYCLMVRTMMERKYFMVHSWGLFFPVEIRYRIAKEVFSEDSEIDRILRSCRYSVDGLNGVLEEKGIENFSYPDCLEHCIWVSDHDFCLAWELPFHYDDSNIPLRRKWERCCQSFGQNMTDFYPLSISGWYDACEQMKQMMIDLFASQRYFIDRTNPDKPFLDFEWIDRQEELQPKPDQRFVVVNDCDRARKLGIAGLTLPVLPVVDGNTGIGCKVEYEGKTHFLLSSEYSEKTSNV